MKDIDIKDFILMKPQSIKKIKQETELYDIEVDSVNNFFIKANNCDVLSHNCDGNHIAALILNLFAKWFPETLKENKIFKLDTPLLSHEENGERKYLYSLEDVDPKKEMKKVRYLKGLGSLDVKDWDYIFKNLNKLLTKFKSSQKSNKYLDVAFGTDSRYRKNWLKN